MYANRGNALAEILSTYKRAERKQVAVTRRADAYASEHRSARPGSRPERKLSASHR